MEISAKKVERVHISASWALDMAQHYHKEGKVELMNQRVQKAQRVIEDTPFTLKWDDHHPVPYIVGDVITARQFIEEACALHDEGKDSLSIGRATLAASYLLQGTPYELQWGTRERVPPIVERRT